MKNTVINLKSDIYIECFDKDFFEIQLEQIINMEPEKKIIYFGSVDNISTDIAKMFCDWMIWDEQPEQRRYKNYGKCVGVTFPFTNAKDSIKSACGDKYCVIYKKN